MTTQNCNTGTWIRTGHEVYDSFFPRIKGFMHGCILGDYVDGHFVKGYRAPDTRTLWIRDHTHQMKAYRYWETDMTSMVENILRHQMADGHFYDYYHAGLDYDGKLAQRRVEVESDVEYLVVLCCHLAWQATGDDDWIARQLPILERAMDAMQSDPHFWNAERQLVQRGFTIDTWDFGYLNFPFKREKHKRCIMFGDNSGMYAAYKRLEQIYRHLGDKGHAQRCAERAAHFQKRTNEVCWNGRWYTHQIHIDPVDMPGVDEASQISLSNPYTINRGLPTHAQAVSILEEYRRRRNTSGAFAEWFSIDPPFPFPFTSEGWSTAPDNYLNGGIMPLVGGELARAAFEHGMESYGVDILNRYHNLIAPQNETYVWYHRDGKPGHSSDQTLPCDGWGSGAMLYAFMEGLVGVVDEHKCFETVRLSPRWVFTDCTHVEANVAYGAGGAGVFYAFDRGTDAITLTVSGSPKTVNFHVPAPLGRKPVRVIVNDRPVPFVPAMVESTAYADFTCAGKGPVVARIEHVGA